MCTRPIAEYNSSFVQRLLQDCLRRIGLTFFLPKRLVDVQATGAGEDGLRIVVSANLSSPETVRYAALSYCWGGKSPFKDDMLNKAKKDIAAMERSLHFSQISAVYQDAVKTTRHLGIRYLWIDALCIAQGDVNEWKTESLKMAETYSHAFVTIAADASSTCDESFLDIQPYRGLSAGIEVPGSEFCGVGSRSFARIADESLYKHYDKTGFPPCASMMEKRGWTFQEGLLSRRVLSFRHTNVHFRCMERVDGDYDHDFLFPTDSSWREMLRSPTTASLTAADVLNVWDGVLKNFTPRDLTEADDRLVAIAGVATVLRSRSGAGNLYWAGLWKDLFVEQLLWVRDSLHKRERQTQHLKAPSWSWASLMGPVGYVHQSKGRLIWYTKVVRSPSSGDDFDGTKSGPVAVEGPFVDAVAAFEIDLQSIAPADLGYCVQTRRGAHLDTPIEVAQSPDKSGANRMILQRARSNENKNSIPAQAHIHLLLLCAGKRTAFYNSTTKKAYFLLLTKTREDEERYSRIGVWEADIFYPEWAVKLQPDQIPIKYIEDLPTRRISLI